jgi:hypothetical protein
MRTRAVEDAMKAVEKEFAEKVPEAFAGDGVAFLQTVYKDPRQSLNVRMDAAAKAARFERPMLASTNVRVIRRIEDLTDEELQMRGAGYRTRIVASLFGEANKRVRGRPDDCRHADY